MVRLAVPLGAKLKRGPARGFLVGRIGRLYRLRVAPVLKRRIGRLYRISR